MRGRPFPLASRTTTPWPHLLTDLASACYSTNSSALPSLKGELILCASKGQETNVTKDLTTTQTHVSKHPKTPRHPRPRILQRLLFYLGIFGPGLIAANAGNDPGGIATYSTMGSQFGYSMLWVMPILVVGVAIVQEMCARMGAMTGKGLSDLIREN